MFQLLLHRADDATVVCFVLFNEEAAASKVTFVGTATGVVPESHIESTVSTAAAFTAETPSTSQLRSPDTPVEMASEPSHEPSQACVAVCHESPHK